MRATVFFSRLHTDYTLADNGVSGWTSRHAFGYNNVIFNLISYNIIWVCRRVDRRSTDHGAASGSPGEVVFKSQGACATEWVKLICIDEQLSVCGTVFFLSLLYYYYYFIYLFIFIFCSLPTLAPLQAALIICAPPLPVIRCFFSRARSFWSGAPGRTTHTRLLDRLGLASCVRITHRRVTNVATCSSRPIHIGRNKIGTYYTYIYNMLCVFTSYIQCVCVCTNCTYISLCIGG